MLSVLFGVALLSVALSAADISGVWTIEFEKDFGGYPGSNDCTFKQEGAKLTVTCDGATSRDGRVDDRRAMSQMPTGRNGEMTATFAGDLDADGRAMKGTWRIADRDGEFTAHKQ